jgi:hypothetical protein
MVDEIIFYLWKTCNPVNAARNRLQELVTFFFFLICIASLIVVKSNVQRLVVSQLAKNIATFHGSRMFSAMCTRARHLSLRQKENFALGQAIKAQKRSTDIALLFP